MNQTDTGALIRALRKEQGLTQRGLAQLLGITAQAVSKWERGMGCPDADLLCDLAQTLGTQADTLLSGRLAPNERTAENMKKLQFYVCPHCGNIITSATPATVSCCGKTLLPLTAKKAGDTDKLHVELIENEYYISTSHEMTREHFISFVALLTGDSVLLHRCYPEWDLQTHIAMTEHGKLVWYCTRHGLFYQFV